MRSTPVVHYTWLDKCSTRVNIKLTGKYLTETKRSSLFCRVVIEEKSFLGGLTPGDGLPVPASSRWRLRGGRLE